MTRARAETTQVLRKAQRRHPAHAISRENTCVCIHAHTRVGGQPRRHATLSASWGLKVAWGKATSDIMSLPRHAQKVEQVRPIVPEHTTLAIGDIQSGGTDAVVVAERLYPADTRAGHVAEYEAHVVARRPRAVIDDLGDH
jgi:hypothetical protein